MPGVFFWGGKEPNFPKANRGKWLFPRLLGFFQGNIPKHLPKSGLQQGIILIGLKFDPFW
jgi:hypothetical protein